MSPERLSNKPYSFNADIWSLGVIALQMALLEYPFQCKSFIDLIQYFQKNENLIKEKEILKNYSKNFVNFLKLCLIKNAEKRPLSGDLLTHKWLFIN